VTKRRVKRVTPQPARAANAPADLNAWARRFTVWIAPAADSGHHLCIGAGATRAAAVTDAETELRGALGLLGKDADRPRCEKCGWRTDVEAR